MSSDSDYHHYCLKKYPYYIVKLFSGQDHHSLDAGSDALRTLQEYIASDTGEVHFDEASTVSLSLKHIQSS